MTQAELEKQFQDTLGRAPNSSEMQYFLGANQKEYLNPYTTGLALQGTAEGQQRFLDQQTNQYQAKLGQSDMQQLGMARDTLTSQFLNQGRRYSSGYTAAFADAAGQLAQARQQQVASYYGQGLGNIAADRNQQGQNYLNMPTNRAEQDRKFQQEQQLALSNYYRQKNDYNDYLNAQNRQNRQGAIGSLIGSGLGMIAGSMIPGAGVAGAMLGGSLGSGLGGQAGRF